MCVQLKRQQPRKSAALSEGWWGRRLRQWQSLSPSCFAKKNVVQGWPVTLFCLVVDKVLYHPLSERMFSQRCRNGLMLQS